LQSSINQDTGAWVLENGFSIETWGWDLICNQNLNKLKE
jgi:hypothetical protein